MSSKIKHNITSEENRTMLHTALLNDTNWTSSVKFRIDLKILLTYEAINDLASIQVTLRL